MMSLAKLREEGVYDARALLTTCTRDYDRISMHAVRRELLEAQVKNLGMNLDIVWLETPASYTQYEEAFLEALLRWKEKGIEGVAFGDIFLEDLREYRIKLLKRVGLEAMFPIWGSDTTELVYEFIRSGYKAVTTCIDPKKMPEEFVGRIVDNDFVLWLPTGVDSCGERGEFHTFVYDGPLFTKPLPIKRGEKVLREGFWFCDYTLV